MAEIICGGFGGQGILTTGMIIANIGVDEGKDVSWMPSYGSEMRGGTANCNVIISDDEVGSPAITYPDYLVVMNAPALEKFQHKVRKTGGILIDSSMVGEGREFPEGIAVYSIPATDLANDMKNPKGANVIMLGAFVAMSGLFSADIARAGLFFFKKKGMNSPKNNECFDIGIRSVKRIR